MVEESKAIPYDINVLGMVVASGRLKKPDHGAHQ